MAKPIIVINIPRHENINGEEIENIIKNVEQRTENEYHTIPILVDETDDIKFQVFYDKDFTEANYEKLK